MNFSKNFLFYISAKRGPGIFWPSLCFGIQDRFGSLSNVGVKSKTTRLNKGVHSMKQGCVLLAAIYIDGCFYRDEKRKGCPKAKPAAKLPNISWPEQRFSYEGKDFHKPNFASFIVNLLTKRVLCESHCEKIGKSHNKTRNSWLILRIETERKKSIIKA